MRFGKAEDISAIDFSLPNDVPSTKRVLSNVLNSFLKFIREYRILEG